MRKYEIFVNENVKISNIYTSRKKVNPKFVKCKKFVKTEQN